MGKIKTPDYCVTGAPNCRGCIYSTDPHLYDGCCMNANPEYFAERLKQIKEEREQREELLKTMTGQRQKH